MSKLEDVLFPTVESDNHSAANSCQIPLVAHGRSFFTEGQAKNSSKQFQLARQCIGTFQKSVVLRRISWLADMFVPVQH